VAYEGRRDPVGLVECVYGLALSVTVLIVLKVLDLLGVKEGLSGVFTLVVQDDGSCDNTFVISSVVETGSGFTVKLMGNQINVHLLKPAQLSLLNVNGVIIHKSENLITGEYHLPLHGSGILTPRERDVKGNFPAAAVSCRGW